MAAVRPIKQGKPTVITEDQIVPEKKVKVRVSDRWQVTHDGKQYVKDDELTVPEELAHEWERARWVEKVTGKG